MDILWPSRGLRGIWRSIYCGISIDIKIRTCIRGLQVYSEQDKVIGRHQQWDVYMGDDLE